METILIGSAIFLALYWVFAQADWWAIQ